MNIYTMHIWIIIWVFVPIANTVFAISYKDPLPENIWIRSVSTQNITEASLLQTYVTRYRENINNTYESYSSQESIIIENTDKTLGNMNKVLRSIQQNNVAPEVVNEVMQSIVRDLKTINSRMKVFLQQQRDIHDQNLSDKKAQYEKIGVKISKILDTLITWHTRKLIQIESISERQKNLVKVLVKIQEENSKIKDFSEIRFEDEWQMRTYFQNIINNIRREVQNMKKYL